MVVLKKVHTDETPSWGSGGCVRLRSSCVRPAFAPGPRFACALPVRGNLVYALAEALSTPWSPLHFTVLLVVSILCLYVALPCKACLCTETMVYAWLALYFTVLFAVSIPTVHDCIVPYIDRCMNPSMRPILNPSHESFVRES